MIALLITIFCLLGTPFAIIPKFHSQTILNAIEIASSVSLKAALHSLLEITQAGEYSQVADILETIREEFETLLTTLDTNFVTAKAAYDSSSENYGDSINLLDSEISDTNNQLDAAGVQLDSFTASIQNNRDAISQAQTSKAAELQRRADAEASFETNLSDIDQASAACDEALELLGEVQNADLGVVGSSFIETRRQKLHAKLVHIQQKMSKVRTRHPIAPFINTLVEVAQDSINADAIATIEAMIQDLKNSLQANRDAAVQADSDDETSSGVAVANYQSTIDTQSDALNQNSQSLNDVNGQIDNLNTQLGLYKNNLETATDSLNDLNASYATSSEALSDQISRLQDDIAALEQALAFLRTQSS